MTSGRTSPGTKAGAAGAHLLASAAAFGASLFGHLGPGARLPRGPRREPIRFEGLRCGVGARARTVPAFKQCFGPGAWPTNRQHGSARKPSGPSATPIAHKLQRQSEQTCIRTHYSLQLTRSDCRILQGHAEQMRTQRVLGENTTSISHGHSRALLRRQV